jgi:hypothetical protein
MMLSIQDLDELRAYVQTTLCERLALDPKHFPMDESLLVRARRPCGLYFCQHGPRLVKAHAVWDARHSVVAFYDSTGLRFHQVRLMQGPDPLKLAA